MKGLILQPCIWKISQICKDGKMLKKCIYFVLNLLKPVLGNQKLCTL